VRGELANCRGPLRLRENQREVKRTVPDTALSVRDLTVRYPHSDSDAVSGASLELGHEKIAIVGPNGSGKTTLLKAALGLVPITMGSVRVLGHDVRTVRGEVGVGTNLEEVYRLMTVPVDGLISIWSELTGRSDEEVRRWIDDFGLGEVLERPLFHLSTGQTKLVGDLLAIAFSPRLLLLDEPFDNVDFGRRRKYIDLLARSPAAVALGTHELDLLPSFPGWGLYFMFEGQLIGRFVAADIDRLYVSRGQRADALANFRTSIGEVAVTLDDGDVPMKGVSNLSYLLDRIA
jgi:ABC-type multidrug transport system ATPase subunit